MGIGHVTTLKPWTNSRSHPVQTLRKTNICQKATFSLDRVVGFVTQVYKEDTSTQGLIFSISSEIMH